MQRKSFQEMQCGIAQSLELIGDWWTLLIVREALFGTCRFEEFCRNLGIARNTLSKRLENLVAADILYRRADPDDGRCQIYELTEAGRDLHVVLASIWQWGNRWIYGESEAPSFIVEAETGIPIAPLNLRNAEGDEISLASLAMAPGRTAGKPLRERIEQSNRRSAARTLEMERIKPRE